MSVPNFYCAENRCNLQCLASLIILYLLSGGEVLDWQIRMNQVIDYLESKMQENVDLNKAARYSGYSLLDFQRIFSFLTNTSVGMYIRRRKLSLAADDIISGNEKS